MPIGVEGWMWWGASTVIVGIVLNIASAYLKPVVDRQLEKHSDYRRISNEQKRMEIEKEASALLKHPEDLAGFFAYRIRIIMLTSSALVSCLIYVSAITILSHLPEPGLPDTRLFPSKFSEWFWLSSNSAIATKADIQIIGTLLAFLAMYLFIARYFSSSK